VAEDAAEPTLERRDTGQGAVGDVDGAHAGGVEQLPDVVEIEADLRLRQYLAVGVIGFIAFWRFIADSIETRNTAPIVDQAAIEGPTLIAQASELVLGIEGPFDPLLDPRIDRRLRVFG